MTGRDAQSDLFRGVSEAPATVATGSVKGIATTSIPAFVAGEELADLADADQRIVAMTADLASANRLADFGARHPSRFFDLGIAEKNMITAAAGLAAAGLIPFVAPASPASPDRDQPGQRRRALSVGPARRARR